MKAEELISRLTLPEKEHLLKVLQKAVLQEQGEIDLKNRDTLLRDVCRNALEIMGIPKFEPKSKKRNHVVCRVIIANLLMDRGYSEQKVGDVLEKNHSTIHWLKNTMRTWKEFPNAYKEELSYWKKLNEIYEADRITI